MDLDFSDEQKMLREHLRRFFDERCPSRAVRAVLESESDYDEDLYHGLAELGVLGAAIPEEFGGAGIGYLELCVLAEEIGRAVAPVPVSSSIYLAAELLLLAGTEDQKRTWLPLLASGEAVGTLALAEAPGRLDPEMIRARCDGGLLHGTKAPVPDGSCANFAIVPAWNENDVLALYLVVLNQPAACVEAMDAIDPSRKIARITFDGARAEPMAETDGAWSALRQCIDRAAVLIAFEQIGGADRALEMGRDYSLDRMAFGRPIGSFQALKHMMADLYVGITLARSNSYYAAWALSVGAADLGEAAALARVAASEAYLNCAKDNIQLHGGMGFTWEFDCHLHYRRANALALLLGSRSEWSDLLITRMSGETGGAA